MAGGIPAPERGAPVFTAVLKLDQIYDLGQTPFGHRKVGVVTVGTVTGKQIQGGVMPGGLDLELSFTNGAMELEEVLVLKTDDGKYIYMRSRGTAADAGDARLVPDFEAPSASSYQWLNTGKFVARRTLDSAAKTITVSVFDVSKIDSSAASTNAVIVTKPADLPDQPWTFRHATAGEKRGEQIVSEHVTLGPGQSVGDTKNGGRNIIPITGGTLSGRISGKVLNAGADYQKLANPMTLDARYLWQTDDGEIIIVRNGGTFALLAPMFEVRTNSRYAWLNQGTYLSSGPNVGADGVRLNFYQSHP